jgi:hypothetical protein
MSSFLIRRLPKSTLTRKYFLEHLNCIDSDSVFNHKTELSLNSNTIFNLEIYNSYMFKSTLNSILIEEKNKSLITEKIIYLDDKHSRFMNVYYDFIKNHKVIDSFTFKSIKFPRYSENMNLEKDLQDASFESLQKQQTREIIKKLNF